MSVRRHLRLLPECKAIGLFKRVPFGVNQSDCTWALTVHHRYLCWAALDDERQRKTFKPLGANFLDVEEVVGVSCMIITRVAARKLLEEGMQCFHIDSISDM